ncbi:MAG: hypothetical protein V3R90_12685 [Limibaculum sp.]
MAFDALDPPKLRRAWHTPCFDNLNKLEWPCGFSVTCFGVRICLRANDPGLLEKLRGLLPADARPYHGAVVDHYFSAILGGRAEGSRIRKFHILYGNHDTMFRGGRLDHLLDVFERGFRMEVASFSPRRIFVHAGAVGWKGQAILVPGKSLSGKTTLIAELVRAGASYFSDEYAVLDAAGRVHPFDKPLSIRANPAARQVETPVEALGGRAARRSLPVGLVVMSTYRDGARWRPRTLTPGHGALAVFANTITAWHAPVRAMTSIREVVAHAPVVRSSRGDAAEVAPLILQLLERRNQR